MAVSQNTLIGRTRGSVGGVTFTKWKGLNVLKAKPEEVENPQTVPQQTQRNRLALMVAAYRSMAASIAIGFKELAINKSEYNAFVSENIQDATQITVAPAVEMIPQNLVIAKGALSPTPIDSSSATDGNADVTINYPSSLGAPDQALSDLAFAVVHNATQEETGQALGTDVRSDGSIVVTMPTNCATGDSLAIYLFFKEDGGDRCSDSQVQLLTV